jgi:hypothetical protein
MLFREKSVFILSITLNACMHSVGKRQSFKTSNHVAHTVNTMLWGSSSVHGRRNHHITPAGVAGRANVNFIRSHVLALTEQQTATENT